MTCNYCDDGNGGSIFPIYGVGPHICYYKIKGAKIGQSIPLPKTEWPSNYEEDTSCPGLGHYWCPECGEGNFNGVENELSI